MFNSFFTFIDSILARDPAARSRAHVILLYPGVHAVLIYRAAHGLWQRKFFFLALALAQAGRLLTGIEIHPGARIGRNLFIDHGMGVVIGETAVLGDDITLYQNVTLGGVSSDTGKRHPTLEAGVTVGAGAIILGDITIGAGARIGANAVVLQDVAPGATAVGVPAHTRTS
jgi:serine O-acetyltransferase